MPTNVMADSEHCVDPQVEQVEARNLESVSLELQRRLDDASRALEELKAQQTTLQSQIDDASRSLEGLNAQQARCSTLLNQFQADLGAALVLGREMKELVDTKAEERSGMVATLQAAVEKTKETVVGQVEHVRERAVAAFHRLKGDNSGEGHKKFEDKH